jgi:hypothetical protein
MPASEIHCTLEGSRRLLRNLSAHAAAKAMRMVAAVRLRESEHVASSEATAIWD